MDYETYKTFGLTIGDKHTYKDWGLILNTFTVSPPKPKTKYVSVPFRDGDIDLTSSLTNNVNYNNREISATFSICIDRREWEILETEIINYLHGQEFRITPDDDKMYFYKGRVEETEFSTENSYGKLVLKANVDPFKYEIQGTADDWLWDPFDFEEGYISGGSIVPVAGEEVIFVLGRRKYTYPTIRCSEPMELEFLGTKYQLPAGLTKAYDVMIREGENKLIFRGNGNVTVDYRGGEL